MKKLLATVLFFILSVSLTSPVFGATMQGLGKKGVDWVDVKDFGARADGVTNDSDAIQSAIDSLPGGGTVYLPKGTYRLDKQSGNTYMINVPANTKIIGAGVGATILKPLDSMSTGSRVFQVTTTDVEISNLEIDGNKSRLDPGDIAVGEDEGIDLKSGAKRVWIHNVYIHDAGQDAIDIDDSEDVVVQNVILKNNGGNGVHITGTSQTRRILLSGIIAESNGHERKANSTGIQSDSAAGIDVSGGAIQVNIINCLLKKNARSIVVGSADRVTIAGSTIDDPGDTDPDIGISVINAAASRIVITGNTIRTEGVAVEGILLALGSDIEVTDNVITGSSPAIHIDGAGTVVVANNLIDPLSGGRGIEVSDIASGDEWVISGNLIKDTGYGIYIEDGKGLISGNYIENVSQQGIDLRGSGVDDVSVIGNRVRTSSNNGIRLLSSPVNTVILGNDVPDGISVSGSGHIIRDNIVSTTDTVSGQSGFITDGGTTSLTCGSGNQGKMQVMDNGDLQYCDGGATSTLRVITP